jgi:hypothetical protein
MRPRLPLVVIPASARMTGGVAIGGARVSVRPQKD